MATDNIDRIIQEFIPESGSLSVNCGEVVTSMAGEISRLRHAHKVQYELERPGGCWVSYFYDYTAQIASVHFSELEALRCALDNHHNGAIFLPYGIRLHEALEAKENLQR